MFDNSFTSQGNLFSSNRLLRVTERGSSGNLVNKRDIPVGSETNPASNDDRDANRITPELITAPEFARLLNISERSFYRLKSIGRIPPSISLGGSIRWSLSQVRQWIAEGCPTPASSE